MDLSNLSQKELDECYIQACTEGNLETIKSLYDLYLKKETNKIRILYRAFFGISEPENKPKLNIHQSYALESACRKGSTNIIKFLTSVPEFKVKSAQEGNKYPTLVNEELSRCVYAALTNNEIESAELLLPFIAQDKEFKSVIKHAFTYACGIGSLQLVKFMLTNPYLSDMRKEIISGEKIGSKPDYAGFASACENGKLEIVKYLISSPELSEHIDLNVIHRQIKIDNVELARYFIFDLNVNKNHPFYSIIKFKENSEASNLFDKAELFEQIEKNLNSTNNKDSRKRPKI